MVQRVKYYYVFFSCLFTFCFIYWYNYKLNSVHNIDIKSDKITRKGFLVDTSGCQIPELDPFDPELRKFYIYTETKKCPNIKSLASSNRTHLEIDLNIVKKIHGNNAICGYKRIWRKGNNRTDNEYGMDVSYNTLTKTILVTDEFLNVVCFKFNENIYKDFFPFIQIKPEVEKKCERKSKNWLDETKNTVTERMNVIIVGIDSVSRLNMIRHMPKTFNYLNNVMDAIDLHGFTKLADNTFVNIVPMLTGLLVEECWNESMKDKGVDYMDFIWKDYASKGYRTLYAEDYPRIAGFNFLKSGFFQQPTDYYYRPFTLAVENLLNVNDCYNNRLEVDVITNWLIDFLVTFKNKPTFSFVYNSRLTHERLNDAGRADEPYYNFLTKIHNSNFINNSVLVFFSDHGIRYGNIRNTYAGKIEERMPFNFLVFPKWFKSKYPKMWKNLKINENRLTTSFDIYATLKDILYFTGEVRKADLNNRGISLFMQIPEERTCKDAAILPHWCTCEEKTVANVNDVIVKKAASLLIDFLNTELLGESKCAKLTLDQITDARVSGLNEKILRFRDSVNDVINRRVIYTNPVNGIHNYLITVSVKPSKALFEGTVQYVEKTKMFIVNKEISRINEYGDQSVCVQNEKLRKYCYCKKY